MPFEPTVSAEQPTPLDRVNDNRFRVALIAAIKDLPERELPPNARDWHVHPYRCSSSSTCSPIRVTGA